MMMQEIQGRQTGAKTGTEMPMGTVMRYIDQHFMEQITLERVAALAGFNSSYFSTIFKRRCGKGFMDYLTEVRIQKAQELLQKTAAPITEICFRVGYKDLKHFNRTFKRLTSMTPSEYKRQQKGTRRLPQDLLPE